MLIDVDFAHFTDDHCYAPMHIDFSEIIQHSTQNPNLIVEID